MAWGQPDQRLGQQVLAPAAASWLQLPALNPGPAIDAAGESHYQDALETVGGGRTGFVCAVPSSPPSWSASPPIRLFTIEGVAVV